MPLLSSHPAQAGAVKSDVASTQRFAGIHLSGSNAHKTAAIVLQGVPLFEPLKVTKLYERIGSSGSLFSDERLVEILLQEEPLTSVFVDCPLTTPPCVTCQRGICPGVLRCEDVSVAYMLSLSDRVKKKRAQKARPLNPQSQRLWDVLRTIDTDKDRPEPSFSANMAPLVTRARTLQRRLNGFKSPLILQETSVSHVLQQVAGILKLPESVRLDYRNFEIGLDRRRQVLSRLIAYGWLQLPEEEEQANALIQSVEVFHALLSAWVASLYACGLTGARPQYYLEQEGWVFLPEFSKSLAKIQPRTC